mmetsp:Transcript_47410/g.94598  ORF Transcript_47410/g.94598 Transcript_47410/m.94598 type:complete len:227 (+) Transcript_47410:1630-2310(+)
MQSITSRALSSVPSTVEITAAPGLITTLASGERSNTTPPEASKRARASATSRSGRTPTLSTSCSHTSLPPEKPQRTGLNSMPITSSSSAVVRTPAATSSSTSFRLAFQSCSRPRSSPASSTPTRRPRTASAVARRMPMFPPHTTTSKAALSGGVSGSSKTTRRGGGTPRRSDAHASSSRNSPSQVLCPPAPPVCASTESVCMSDGVRSPPAASSVPRAAVILGIVP